MYFMICAGKQVIIVKNMIILIFSVLYNVACAEMFAVYASLYMIVLLLLILMQSSSLITTPL